jgi:hypothetical protein
VDGLLGDLGIAEDSMAGRQAFERPLEPRRHAKTPTAGFRASRRGWRFGPPEFRKAMLTRMGEKPGPSHRGELHQESATAKAGRIMAEELLSRKLMEQELQSRRKGDRVKKAIAARPRQETTVSLKSMAARVGLGTSNCANARLQK